MHHVCIKIQICTFVLWKGTPQEESVSVGRQQGHGVIKTGKSLLHAQEQLYKQQQWQNF